MRPTRQEQLAHLRHPRFPRSNDKCPEWGSLFPEEQSPREGAEDCADQGRRQDDGYMRGDVDQCYGSFGRKLVGMRHGGIANQHLVGERDCPDAEDSSRKDPTPRME